MRPAAGCRCAVRPRPRVDAFAEKIEEWVDRSRGRIRADVAHQRLVAMGYRGSERTTRRAVAEAKRRVARRARPAHAAVDHRAGAVDAVGLRRRARGRRPRDGVVLRLAGVEPLPGGDRAVGSDVAVVVMALDRALRAFGGAPTYALTDNERTVSIDHVCGIAVRNPQIVAGRRATTG